MRVRRRSKRILYVGLGVFVAVFLFSFLMQRFKGDGVVDAASLAGFDPGYIISDYQMSNYNSMSEAEIQAFLTAKNPCGNRDYGLYQSMVSSYPSIKWHWDNGHFICISEERFGDGEVIGSGDTAAHIIWQAAQDYRINPQVLIVLLQKEQGLITDDFPNSRQYRSATGYGCPDTAPCSTQYYGFKNQVRKAAAMFRTVLDGGWTNYPLGNNYIQYNPNAGCGGSVVNIRSLATSALYRYTPYQPNAGALAAGYGTAYCGAYGNRNFYLYFEDWFGGVTKEKANNSIEPVDVKEENKERIHERAEEVKKAGYDMGNSLDEVYCYKNSNNGNNYCVQRYDNGYLISTPSGVWESYGEIRKRWAELDYENGILGYPRDEVYCYNNSDNDNHYCVQRYDNGYLISTPSGVWESYGEIRKRWSELGYENGILGYPRDEVYCYKNSNNGNNYCVQRYDNGYLISTPSGVWESYGEIRKRWSSTDFERGMYGYPRGSVELKNGKEFRQQYDGGMITLN
ncbi:hypothetical protein IKF04_01585 [Candidatus Saccharibacteria bacterium]|nr:hypothetical protein [Candidatus Saccharibacteria bacterium]